MEYIPSEACTKSIPTILCCQCGSPIQPNPANMCIPCLRSRVDITEAIPKEVVIHFCRGCSRYLQPPAQWVKCSLESRELLAFCLKKLNGLSQVHLVDATFVWTEPHSKRIKVKLTVQKEVFGGAILQQVFVVEYFVNYHMCHDCHRSETKHFWKSVVQVRQRVQHKKTFFYLEQLILKHNIHANCINIKTTTDGLDFYFAKKDDASKLVDFINTVIPCRYKYSQHLLSHDVHSNIFNYKSTYCVEIVPICKDDVVCLSRAQAKSLGSLGQISICRRVMNNIFLIDPQTIQIAEISSQPYWRSPFLPIGSLKQYTKYTVMDINFIPDSEKISFSGQGAISFKHVLSDAWVVKSSELGRTDAFIHTRTHLGHLLRPGDIALGLDLSAININNDEFNKLSKDQMPDVILVKKIYEKVARHNRRKWKLKRLNMDAATDNSSIERDFEDFMEDLEEDVEYRKKVNIYKDPAKLAVDTSETDDDDFPKITLQDMLDDLTLEDQAIEEDGSMLQ